MLGYFIAIYCGISPSFSVTSTTAKILNNINDSKKTSIRSAQPPRIVYAASLCASAHKRRTFEQKTVSVRGRFRVIIYQPC